MMIYGSSEQHYVTFLTLPSPDIWYSLLTHFMSPCKCTHIRTHTVWGQHTDFTNTLQVHLQGATVRCRLRRDSECAQKLSVPVSTQKWHPCPLGALSHSGECREGWGGEQGIPTTLLKQQGVTQQALHRLCAGHPHVVTLGPKHWRMPVFCVRCWARVPVTSGESLSPHCRSNWTQALCCPAQARCRAEGQSNTTLVHKPKATPTW